MTQSTLITGFPRIGEKRELKYALENYWAGKISQEKLIEVSNQVKEKQWKLQQEKGMDLISCNDFSLYDRMLDTAVMLNAIPERFRSIENDLTRYFAMARGTSSAVALEMTKWFNTNYHYIVPELRDSMDFKLNASKIIQEYKQAQSQGIRNPKINIIGPLTFLELSKSDGNKNAYNYYDEILSVYEKLMRKLSKLDNIVYLQIEEPIFVENPAEEQLQILEETYQRLSHGNNNLNIIFTTYFEHAREATKIIANTDVWGIALDFVHGEKNLESLKYFDGQKLIAGVVDGRNIWINDIEKTQTLLDDISKIIDSEQIIISTSCSLQYVPYTLDNEPDSEIKKWLSFAHSKVDEVALIDKMFREKKLTEEDKQLKSNLEQAIEERGTSDFININGLQEQIENISKQERDSKFEDRNKIQKEKFQLPPLPSTTIGSFPQTEELRQLRRDLKSDKISREEYEEGIKNYIDETIEFQEKIGLDVLVHGEPERNDMVEYFGEKLEGFHFTQNGWVQSYGSRCVKPPIIYGDVSRPEPMTVKWISYAQNQTEKIVKGMLTGPVTILKWSFVREDKSRREVSRQIAAALRDEIKDLQEKGIKSIQVDEAAFKEGYPLREENISDYEDWAVRNFKLAVSPAKKETQIHTHMCYSDFGNIIDTIEAMDADVITIETARSGNSILNVFKETGYKNEIGPGVYDIHSPRVPSVEEFEAQIRSRMEVLPVEQLWVNPDCGLKTRKWKEVKPALTNMVEAVQKIRESLE